MPENHAMTTLTVQEGLELEGQQWIGGSPSRLGAETFQAVDPTSEASFGPEYVDATAEEIQRALELATQAHHQMAELPRHRRAELLRAIADAIEGLGEPLLERAAAETALPLPRLRGERGRTTSQLRTFAEQVRQGSYLEASIETAQPDRQPIPKPDLRKMRQAVGPVVVFGASNFPLAFSVAGGDTASALAAGCPVVVKAHPHHPGTSELVAAAITRAVAETGFPEGTFSLLHGRGHGVGIQLVQHPQTRAVAFTGSLRGGKALFDLAMARPEPIPVYAEMGSVNPFVILPEQLRQEGAQLAQGLAGSVSLGVGQFCTNPGLVVALECEALDTFAADLGSQLDAAAEGTMLHAGIRDAYLRGIEALSIHDGVRPLTASPSSDGTSVRAAAYRTDGATFLAHPELGHEVFGPVTLLVGCSDVDQLGEVLRSLDGQLTATVHGTDSDLQVHRPLVRILEDKVGRLLFAGFPTGVEICPAMHHGGPYPATTDAATTSVGSAAIQRFSRPICYQDAPQAMLPVELRDGNPDGLWRLIDGEWSQAAV